MKVLHGIILSLALLLSVNALPKLTRHQMEARLRKVLAPGFRDALDDQVQKFIDVIVRDLIVNGNEALGVPPLDPLRIDHFDLNFDLDTISIAGVVDDVVASGAAEFRIVGVKTDLSALSADIDIAVDVLRLKGEHYNLEGSILNGALDIYGEGAFEAELRDVKLKVILQLGVKEDESVEVRRLELDVAVGSAKVNFENLLGGGLLGDIANGFVSDELPNLVEANKGPLLIEVADLIKGIANDRLVGVSLDDLLDLINSA